MTPSRPEVWLRGSLPDVPTLVQPPAHGLMQCREEVDALLATLPDDTVWASPAGAATIAYHLRHAAGSLDRLLTYARGSMLSAAQMEALAAERTVPSPRPTATDLAAIFDDAVERALVQIKSTDPATLTEARAVGRGGLPSTVIGLLFHAAEHTQRHVGQAVTTAKFLGGAKRG